MDSPCYLQCFHSLSGGLFSSCTSNFTYVLPSQSADRLKSQLIGK